MIKMNILKTQNTLIWENAACDAADDMWPAAMAPAAFANCEADVAETGCFMSTATNASEARLRSELSFKVPKMSF
jgi:hypothetical protein